LIKKISEKDKKDWEEFINSREKIFDKEVNSKNIENTNKITIDLHGFNLRDANIAIKNLIINSYNKGVRDLNVITGKGLRSKNDQDPYKSNKLGILKFSVPDYIQNNIELMDKIQKININEIENLNKGEFSIRLKKKK
tara:strand:- start:1081 stop:1494 length:414 start_codon:yes stop_codon:yes gene_type:complete